MTEPSLQYSYGEESSSDEVPPVRWFDARNAFVSELIVESEPCTPNGEVDTGQSVTHCEAPPPRLGLRNEPVARATVILAVATAVGSIGAATVISLISRGVSQGQIAAASRSNSEQLTPLESRKAS